MFTGIIESAGKITSIARRAEDFSITVDAGGAMANPVIGESVAVDGVCLTVVSASGPNLVFDVSSETISRTTFKNAKPGGVVNLERAMRLGDRLGGHMVSGHVDCVGTVARISPAGEGYEVEISLPPEGMKYIIEKGSIAIAGISLTVASKLAGSVTIAVIPHTWQNTSLGASTPGTDVNIEYDMISKYVENFVNPGNKDKKGIDAGFLARHGF
ncbi:MAG: riboflavin synthase [Nitrospinae bacterium]|nr:riboflavin synthase [Nitrospinota bacterium]